MFLCWIAFIRWSTILQVIFFHTLLSSLNICLFLLHFSHDLPFKILFVCLFYYVEGWLILLFSFRNILFNLLFLVTIKFNKLHDIISCQFLAPYPL